MWRPGAKCYFHRLLFRRCLGQVTYLSLAFLIGTRGPPAWPHWIVLKMNGNVCAVLGWGRWLAEWPLSRGVSRTSLVSPSRRPPGFLFSILRPLSLLFFCLFLCFSGCFLCVSVSLLLCPWLASLARSWHTLRGRQLDFPAPYSSLSSEAGGGGRSWVTALG